MKLTDSAAKLLRILVEQIHQGRFDANDPQSLLGYGEALEQMELPPEAVRGATDGQTLQIHGMEHLALWLQSHSPPLPAITGLIVSKSSTDINGERRTPFMPGRKFFTVFKRKDGDVPWWLAEARRALAFDWSPYLQNGLAPARAMNSLEHSLIEKAGYANGWENVSESSPQRVILFSARHPAEAHVAPAPEGAVAGALSWLVSFPKGPPDTELLRSFPEMHRAGGSFEAAGEADLGRLLRRAAELAASLPNQAAERFAVEMAKIAQDPPTTTEAMRLVKQRIGQNLFREALMDYWGGACAVTGIAIPELLRASHAKPWAECATDQERLNVFNGFLLCAHLDALFDRGLMTFDSEGKAVFSARVDGQCLRMLGLTADLRLRWVAAEHGPFLNWHRSHLWQK
jgi:hypothetical protein